MKKIILLICLCLSCVTMNAQKWYASATTGCDTYTNLYKDLKFGKTLAPTAAIAVGRDHNPYLGTRLEVRVGNALFSDGENVRMNTPFLMSFADMTCNLTNVVCGLNNRIYDVIIFGGVGDVYNFKNSTYDMKSLNCFALRYGISCDVYVYFRLYFEFINWCISEIMMMYDSRCKNLWERLLGFSGIGFESSWE